MKVKNNGATRRVALILLSAIAMLLYGSVAFAKHRPDHPYRYSIVDMPVSLEVGAVRTPEFPVVSKWYWIMIQVEKPLPFEQMVCMMGVTTSPLDLKDCNSDDPLLRTDWKVWDADHLLTSGSSTTEADGMYTDKYIFKFLGSFRGEIGKRYIVEVRFVKDGKPLNVANPHLIVVKQGEK